MHPVMFILLFAAASFVLMKFIVNPIHARRDAARIQCEIDRNIEWQIMEGLEYPHQITIELLAQHSDKQKIARIMAQRIYEYITMGAHPDKLIKVFKSLGLSGATTKSDEEIMLVALIKDYVQKNISRTDLANYHSILMSDKSAGLSRLNTTFLVQTKKASFVYSPLDN